MMSAVVRLLTLAAIFTGWLTPSTAEAQGFETASRQVVANGPTVILPRWTCWYPDCTYASCHMTTIQEPSLGRLTPHVTKVPIPPNGGACAGRPIAELSITYTPRLGAHGIDTVVMRSMADNGGRHLLYFRVIVP